MKRYLVTILISSLFLLLLLPAAALAEQGPYYITDTPNGGDCSTFGVWDDATNTCTLTRDIDTSDTNSSAIYVGNNAANPIVIDGAGYTITGGDLNAGNPGIYLYDSNFVTLRNLKVSHFTMGIQIAGGDTNTVVRCEFSDNLIGITLTNTTIGTNFNYILGNKFTNNTNFGIELNVAHFNMLEQNTVSGSIRGISMSASITNTVKYNTISNSSGSGIDIYGGSNGNVVFGNKIFSNNNGMNITDSSSVEVYSNRFINSGGGIGSHIVLMGTGTNNIFNKPAPTGGNYYDTWDTAGEGCSNATYDRFCDAPYVSPYGSAVDNLPLARRNYYFTWYDQFSPGAQNWVLMTNPIDAAAYPLEDAWFDLSIAGDFKTLPSSKTDGLPGQVAPMGGITPSFPGLRDGPVEVGYDARMRQMVSQRILWGDSLDEVTGIDAADLSDHYYWTWYDQQSLGFTNWVLLGNPSETETVRAEIRIGGELMQNLLDPLRADYGQYYFDIPAGDRVTPTFPGFMDGPVEVTAHLDNGSTWPTDARDVIASQRVLANYGAAFNEEPGIPETALSNHYIWTWYDSIGGQNWVLLANQNPAEVYYRISVAGGCDSQDPLYYAGHCREGSIPAGETLPVQLPGIMKGPVESWTWSDASHTTPIDTIASQRALWGPSFEETPGYPYSGLSSSYHWTWYDMQSDGAQNWVLVANPSPTPINAEFQIKIGDTLMDLDPDTPGQQGSFVYQGDIKTFLFPGTMSGPVQVIADNDVIASQRVLWKGVYFNEVMGTVLD